MIKYDFWRCYWELPEVFCCIENFVSHTTKTLRGMHTAAYKVDVADATAAGAEFASKLFFILYCLMN